MGSFSLKAVGFFLLILAVSTRAQDKPCPFDFLWHLGDGTFDVGNAIRVPPYGNGLPATRLPYGITFPGAPTGRWSDGLLDIDIGATAMGFPVLTPYLGGNATANNAIIFGVARSPVLDHSFFRTRGVRIPPYAAPLSVQMSWFRKYLSTICLTEEDCAQKLDNSLFLFGDVEGNDVGFPLLQGKSIKEVRTYVQYVTKAQINAARYVIKSGGSRVIIPGNNPLGCYPHILTELGTNNTSDYDEYGCLKNINDLIVYKNNDLQKAIEKLKKEFPNTIISYANFYDAFQQLLSETSSEYRLKSCCGTGGKYNYDSKNFCGSSGVEVCSNTSQYIHWDGIHLTQAANYRLSWLLQQGASQSLDCGPPPKSRSSILREIMATKDVSSYSPIGVSSV